MPTTSILDAAKSSAGVVCFIIFEQSVLQNSTILLQPCSVDRRDIKAGRILLGIPISKLCTDNRPAGTASILGLIIRRMPRVLRRNALNDSSDEVVRSLPLDFVVYSQYWQGGQNESIPTPKPVRFDNVFGQKDGVWR